MAFGRVLKEPLVAFYDLRCRVVPRIEEIPTSPVIFKVWVMNHAVTSGRWPVLGNAPLTDDLLEPPAFFKQDPISGQLSITYVGGGDEVPASFADCLHLERASVWDPDHVEARLNDHFAGRKNRWFESMRPRKRL